MYQKLKKVNKVIKEVAMELNVDTENYNLNSIYKMLLNNKLIECLNNTFINYTFIEESNLNICDKFQYDLIKIYLDFNNIKIKDITSKHVTYELDSYDNNYNIYLNDVNKYNLLSEEKERKLLTDYKLHKNQRSKDILIGSYQKLIINIAKRKTQDQYLLMDLIQVGNIALLLTLESYDLKHNVRLGYFAYRTINCMISRAYNKYKYSDMYSYENMYLKSKLDKYIEKYENKYGIKPTEENIIKELRITKNNLEDIKKINRVESLNKYDFINYIDQDFKEEKKFFDQNILSLENDSENFIESVENKDLIKHIIEVCKNILTPKEFMVIQKLYGFYGPAKKQVDIAKELNVKKQYISQIYIRSIKKIKNDKKIKKLGKIYFEE